MWSLASCLGESIGQEQQARASLVQQSEGRAAALAGFQKFADGLVAQYMVDGKEVDEPTRVAIETVIEFIDKFFESATNMTLVDRTRVANCPGEIESCVTDYITGVSVTHHINGSKRTDDLTQYQYSQDDSTNVHSSDSIATLATATVEERAKHATCRTNQITCAQTQNDNCNLYDSKRATYDSLPACVGMNPGHLSDTFIQADEDDTYDGTTCNSNTPLNGGTTCLSKMETCLVQVKNWHTELYRLYQACKRSDPCQTCEAEQQEFEADHCQWSMARSFACEGYNSCVTRETNRCDEVCTEVEIDVNARKADNETGERIKCLLKVIMDSTDENKPEDLKTCTGTEYNTDWLNIACPAGTPELDTDGLDCGPPVLTEPVPCTAEFLVKEYDDLANVDWCGCRKCANFANSREIEPRARDGTPC